MQKSFLLFVVFCALLYVKGSSQSSAQTTAPTFTYHPPSTDKESWQRLNLWLSTCYFRTATTGMTLDSSLIYVSRSLGMSRLAVSADGIDDPQFLAQSQWFDQRNPGKGVALLSQATGKKHLQQLLLLGSYYLFENRAHRRYKDSIEYFLKKAVDESKTLNEKKLGRQALSLLCKLYAQAGDTVNCNTYFTQLKNECEAEKDKRTLAKTFFYRGLYEVYVRGTVTRPSQATDLLKRRIGYLEKAAALYREINDTEGLIISLVNIGYSHLVLNNNDDGYHLFTRALQLQDSIGYPYTHYTTDNLTMITLNQNKFGEPLKYSLRTVRTAENTRDSIGWPNFYDRLAALYYTEGERTEESLKWMHKALDRYVMMKHGNVYITLLDIVGVMFEQGRRGKEALDLVVNVSNKVPVIDSNDRMYQHLSYAMAYLGLEQYRLAEKHTRSADSIQKLAMFGSANNATIKTLINSSFAAIYFHEGNYAKAKKYVDEYFADSLDKIFIANDLSMYENLITIDSVYNDAPSAVKHYKQYLALLDSNFRASKIRQAEELQVIYETQDKENKITLLNEQAKLEKASLRQATLVKNVTIGGIIAALIIAGLLYRQSRLRKKNNTVITQKNDQLQHLLTEKEWLLKEIHHRVKNNLQIVMSLLNSQSAYIDNEPALTAIHDSQHRVHAMSLIHQKLYNTENVSSIVMSSYIRELATYLNDSFNTGQRIRFEYDIEPLEMDVSQAIPVGLILNEAITNSIKYAFPDGRNGVISIALSNTGSNHYLLSISDNGIGMPAHFAAKRPGSLGMSLMKGLSEDLDGAFSMENNKGTTIKISFVHDMTVRKHETAAALFASNN
jgi:two-component sensor histidine kinase/tetratricopeptide (TPR) repeat protein